MLIGSGRTADGGPHAETQALLKAEQAKDCLKAGTAYVTLEPCAHKGRGPACADAASGGAHRIVYAVEDPDEQC